MGNTYKSKAERLKGDPYIGVCFQALETLEHLNRARGMNRNKRNRYKLLIHATIKQEQLILAQGEDSKKGQLIYLTRRVVFK